MPAVTTEISSTARQALSIVQADLDASGLGQYKMQLVRAGGTDTEPSVVAAQTDGRFWGGSHITVEHRATDIRAVLWTVAGSVQDTLGEVERVIWPRCTEHQDRMASHRPPTGLDG